MFLSILELKTNLLSESSVWTLLLLCAHPSPPAPPPTSPPTISIQVPWGSLMSSGHQVSCQSSYCPDAHWSLCPRSGPLGPPFLPSSLLTCPDHHPTASELKPREPTSLPQTSSKLPSETLPQLQFQCDYILCKSELCDFKRAQAKNIDEISLYAQTLKECKSPKLKKKKKPLRTMQFELHFQWLTCQYISTLALGEPLSNRWTGIHGARGQLRRTLHILWNFWQWLWSLQMQRCYSICGGLEQATLT